MKKENFNEWTFSGEIFYFKVLNEGEFALSLKLRGLSKRVSSMSSQVAEISCLCEADLLKELSERDIKQYDYITLSGHLEQWQSNSKGKPVNKTMLIADYVVDMD